MALEKPPFQRVLERTGMPVGLERLESVTNRDGTAHHEFAPREEIFASVRPDTNNEFEVAEEGQVDAVTHVLGVLERPDGMPETEATDHEYVTYPPVQNDDRVIVSGNQFRAVEKRFSSATGAARLALVEDSRSPNTDSSTPDDGDDSGSDGGTDDPPYTMR